MIFPSDSSLRDEAKTDESDVGLYLHIPFCVKRCYFCAFYLVMQEEKRIERFLSALEVEFALYAAQQDFSGRPVSTIYVGGGTPTALSPTQLARVLKRVTKMFPLSKDCEVTVEATPESVTSAYLETLIDAGVTRLSMGIQTFVREERVRLGLSSPLEEATAGIGLVKQAGFPNFNLDVIYGIPGQALSSWDDTLQQACAWEPTHLSCYALSLEEGTRLEAAFRRGELKVIETDREKVFQETTTERLTGAGYGQYEIANWAKPGRACRHNQRYWQGQDYVGMGPSAQSYLSGCRFGNVANLDLYCRRLENGDLPVAEREQLSMSQQEKERVIFGLRMLEGVPITWLEKLEHNPTWEASLATLIEEQFVVRTSSRLALTVKGRQFADMVGAQLL